MKAQAQGKMPDLVKALSASAHGKETVQKHFEGKAGEKNEQSAESWSSDSFRITTGSRPSK